MKSTTLIELSPQDIKCLMKDAITEHEKEKAVNVSLTKVFSFNQVAKKLGVSHSTVKKLVKEGILKTTADQRKIPAWAVNEYLQNMT